MSARFVTAVGNEIHKGLLHAWSERLQILIELPFFALFILLLGPLLGQGQQIATGHVHWTLSSGTTSVLVVWFMPFIFFYMQVVKMFWRLLGEIQTGTIEQVYLSPLPSWLVVAAGRVVAAAIETLFVASATYGIVVAFVPRHIGWTPAALLPTVLIMATGVGVSLIIAGATLVWKRIQLVNDTVLMLIMLFSAAAVPLITVPGWWADTGRAFPLTAGVASLYNILFRHRPATTAWGMGGLVWLLVTAAGYLTAGIAAFRLGEHTAKRRGTSPATDPCTERTLHVITPTDPVAERVRGAAFRRLLRTSRPASPADLADDLEYTEPAIRTAIDALARQGWLRLDTDGRVIGSAGLSIHPDRHQIDLDGHRFWTWCAYDILGIFAALHVSGHARSIPPDGGEPLHVSFRDGHPRTQRARPVPPRR